MKIGIDARFWGLEHAGIGRYLMELVKAISALDKHTQYLLFIRKQYSKQIDLPQNFTYKIADIKHYTLEEQWLLADIFKSENLDLLHIPHFNVPLFYRRKFVVTIHDLLWHEVKGLSVTTQNPFSYLIKYIGYRKVVDHALKKSAKIMVPSRTIRRKLINEHRVPAEKIVLTYEAPSLQFKVAGENKKILSKYKINKPYILFTGSAYPHKNILKAVEAVKLLNDWGEKVKMVIVSSRSVFLQQLAEQVEKKNASDLVSYLGFVPDKDLAFVYKNALALIQPSISEGYGLTGLEAMLCQTPVVASEIEIFKEIYQDAALLFNPHSAFDLAKKILRLMQSKTLRNSLIKKGYKKAQSFSWQKTAEETLKVYQSRL